MTSLRIDACILFACQVLPAICIDGSSGHRELRIEDAISAKPVAIEGGLLIEQFLHATFGRRILAELSEAEFAQYSGISDCGGGTRCAAHRHDDLVGVEPGPGEPSAYMVLRERQLLDVDVTARAARGVVGGRVDPECGVTCEGCFHSNMVDLWGSVYRHIFEPGDNLNVLVLGEDHASFVAPLEENGIKVNLISQNVPDESLLDLYDIITRFNFVVDVLHVASHFCRLLPLILDLPLHRRPSLVSCLPPRTVPPPFRYQGPDGCSLGWLVDILDQRGFALWKHTDRVTLFRPGHPEEAADEFLCFADYPLLEPVGPRSKWWSGDVAILHVREWILTAHSFATLERIRSNMTRMYGNAFSLLVAG